MALVGCGPEPGHDAPATPSAASTNSAPDRAEAPLVPLTNFVHIQPGAFTRMKHQVTITRDFWIGKYEVTQAEFEAVTGKNPSHFKSPNAPVEKVNHSDAVAYCAALTRRERDAGHLPPGYEYRLPTEAEWEYACRAGTTNQFSFGDALAEADKYAWTWENSGESTHDIGLKEPNPWGLHDTHGNVWEWCLDWFEQYPKTDLTDPVGPAEGKFKVFRGGGWNNEILFARSGNRFMMAPASGIYFVGFRVVLSRSAE